MPRFGADQAHLPAPRLPAMLLFAAATIVGLAVMLRAVNHDESQYVAAIALMRQGLPYRDFAYLQTPLQPLLFSPLALLPAGWMLIGVRIANAILGLATILLLTTALRGRASAAATSVAMAGLLCSAPFLHAASLARNDALAMALEAAALIPLLSAPRSKGKLALAGLLLGLAISAKINAALPAAAAGLFVLLRNRGALLFFIGGILAGLLPTLILAGLAPDAFRFDVFTYNLDAPAQWWTSIGQANELEPVRRIAKLLGFACLGSVLVALAASLLDREPGDERRLLDAMIAGGLVAAYLPAPALVQYLVPLLPPLFARFALALDALRPVARRGVLLLVTVGSLAGLGSAFVARFGAFEAIRSISVGSQVASLAAGGPVVTLSPEFVAGSGVELDPRFAAGPFLFRTRGQLAAKAEAQGRSVPVQSLDRQLAAHPPALIVLGAEGEPSGGASPRGLDQPLILWARRHAYRAQPLGARRLVALVSPDNRLGAAAAAPRLQAGS